MCSSDIYAMIEQNWENIGSANTVQTYYVPPSQPKIWRKIPKIGGVLTLETLTFRMYALFLLLKII